ncbi:OB-fold putative lipoprotein [Rosenbergiella epipactidis]|uniref:OB-fold putative lipoprotein n=1 Tax=Rosenbergiella epipactidis TaxID=1544694 RepID=UPI001F4EB969|nr:OB-fold putative lipoprotein [Rosenbergiella epipactidis]
MYKKVLAVSLLTLLAGCQQMNGVMGSVNSTLDQLNSALEPSATAISGTEICKDYDDNEIAANKKWVGQWVTMTGKVAIISDNQYGFTGQSIHLNVGRKVDAAFHLKPTEESKVVKIKTGQRITMKGKVRSHADAMGCLIILDNGSIQS